MSWLGFLVVLSGSQIPAYSGPLLVKLSGLGEWTELVELSRRLQLQFNPVRSHRWAGVLENPKACRVSPEASVCCRF